MLVKKLMSKSLLNSRIAISKKLEEIRIRSNHKTRLTGLLSILQATQGKGRRGTYFKLKSTAERTMQMYTTSDFEKLVFT
jgi:hypothetical protein